MRARVLVLDGEAPAAVTVVRSLVAAGHRVTVLSAGRHSPAASVRGRQACVRVPAPDRSPGAWCAEVARRAARSRFDVILPVSDVTQILLARIARDLPEGTIPALPVAEGIEALHDKTRVLDRAAALGIPVLPRREGVELRDAARPAVLKPRRSRRIRGDRVYAATARVIGDREGLVAAAANLGALGLGAYAEPWVPGGGRGVFLLLDAGEVLAGFAHRRIRESSPLGGPSAVSESVEMDETLFRQTVRLARDLGVSGPFMAEFRGEGSDWMLLEVNARYWGSLGLAVDAGVDFPALHVDALLGAPPGRPPTWRRGVRRRNLAFDLRYLAIALRGRPPGLDLPWPARLPTLARVIVDDSRGLVYREGDPAPGREHLMRLTRKAFHG